MIVPTANYPTSRDYAQLWELAHTAAIVCIVDMEHGEPDTCRDIAGTIYSPEWSPKLVQVGSRGIGHVYAESLEKFMIQCKRCNLEWLVPPAPAVVPVPVSERLPGEGDLHPEGKWCWGWKHRRYWAMMQISCFGGESDPDKGTHWLPAHAIPLPQAGEGES